MQDSIDAVLLDYYQRELAYLRNAGAQFAKRYPKVANRLLLSDNECLDPQVEHLLQSFALLCARLQRQQDNQYTQLSNALLEQVYPYLARPFPSSSIVQFEPDATQGNLSEGFTIAKEAPLFVSTLTGDTLYFRTTTDLTLWPIKIEDAILLPQDEAQALSGSSQFSSALLLTLTSTQAPFSEMPISLLRLHLSGAATNVSLLYDLIGAHTVKMGIRAPNQAWSWLDTLPKMVGFRPEEALLPHEPGQHPGHALLVEYFLCPEKFAFFDLPLSTENQSSQTLEVILLFNKTQEKQYVIRKENILLNCVPVINLFPRTSEPLYPDGTRSEYRVVADVNRAHCEEIYCIRQVYRSDGKTVNEIPFFFGYYHDQSEKETLYWHARRVETNNSQGSDVLMSFVDTHFNSKSVFDYSITTDLLCTNREITSSLPSGTHLVFEQNAPVSTIKLIQPPHPQVSPELRGSAHWKLVSQMGLNHLSLSEGEMALKALKEMLHLHNLVRSPSIQKQIDGLLQLKSQRIMEHTTNEAWRGWRNGLHIKIELDEQYFVGHSQVLFGSVLAHFFALYATPNRFIRTSLVQQEKVVKTWQPNIDSLLVL